MSAKRKEEQASFQRSSELKLLFNKHSEEWCRRNRLGMSDLAERCGVTTQYLLHIGRYGRVPAKPILFLLAIILDLPDPSALLRAAGIKEAWPFEPGYGLRPKSGAENGFLSLNLDMQGFASAIREIVRTELRPKTLQELLGGRALRVGLNRGQTFMFGSDSDPLQDGFFPEILRMMSLALHCTVEFKDVFHGEFANALKREEVDIYGPIYYTTARVGQALFSNPFCRVNLGALFRTRKAKSLAPLPPPKQVLDLTTRDYKIAVHADSMSHHFAIGELNIPTERIIPCESPEESIERIVMSEVPRPAHVLLTDSPHVWKINAEHPETTEVLFADAGASVMPYPDTLAIRTDWPAVVSIINGAIELLEKNGSLKRLYQRVINEKSCPGVLVS